MPFPQRSSSAVPLDHQSVLPTVRGIPWWGAVILATLIAAIGACIDATNGGDLGAVFNFCYLVGCSLAALAVRRRALFTAAAQPPLIAFTVGVVALYYLSGDGTSGGLKALVLRVLLPIAADFPWMAFTFVVVVILAVLRWALTRPTGWNGKKTNSEVPTTKIPAAASRAGGRSRSRDGAQRRRPTRSAVSGADADDSAATPDSARPRSQSAPSRAASRSTSGKGKSVDAESARVTRRRDAAAEDSTAGQSRRRPADADATPRSRSRSQDARRRTAGEAARSQEQPRPARSRRATGGARDGSAKDSADAPRRRTAGEAAQRQTRERPSAAADLEKYESAAELNTFGPAAETYRGPVDRERRDESQPRAAATYQSTRSRQS